MKSKDNKQRENKKKDALLRAKTRFTDRLGLTKGAVKNREEKKEEALLEVEARFAERTGLTKNAVRAEKKEKPGQSEESLRTEYEWHVKTPISMMHNPLMTKNDGSHPQTQKLYVKVTLVADSLWAALLEDTAESNNRVAKTKHWHGSFGEETSRDYIASRILSQPVGGEMVHLPTLGECINGSGSKVFYHFSPHSEKKYQIHDGSIKRNGAHIQIEGVGAAAAIILFLGSADTHGGNFSIRDDGDRIRLCKFDNKYDLGTSSALEAEVDLAFFKVPVSRTRARYEAELKQLKRDAAIFNMDEESVLSASAGVQKRHKELMDLESKEPQAREKLGADIKKLEREARHVLDPIHEEGQLNTLLSNIFDYDIQKEGANGVGERQVFKIKTEFLKGFAKAPHVREEFLDTLYLITHLPEKKITSLVEGIMGKSDISPVTGKPVSSMIVEQLVFNRKDMAAALKHCPEYQEHIKKHQARLKERKETLEKRIDKSISEQSIHSPKGKRSFVGQLKEERKEQALHTGFTSDL